MEHETLTFYTDNDININNLCNNLAKCANTIYTKRIALKPENFETDIYKYKKKKNKYFMPSVFFEEYEKVSNSCQLNKTDFYYWPINLSTSPMDQCEISICSICFGIMLLNNWLEKDTCLCQQLVTENPDLTKTVSNTIDGAINLLIALRSPEHASWPSSWNFDDNIVEGTINQTTLSLSTLLTSGFLSLESNNIDTYALKNRYYYILKSIEWLINARNTTNNIYGTFTGWSHMEKNHDIILLPTSFSFDTLLKFRNCIEDWVPFFEPIDPDFSQDLNDKINEIDEILYSVLRYFAHEFYKNKSFKRLYDDHDTSISHTAKILKTLLQFVCTTKNNHSSATSLALAQTMIDEICMNLLEKDVTSVLNLKEHELFEQFVYNNDVNLKSEKKSHFIHNKGENYEICGELIYIDALINATEYYANLVSEKSSLLFSKAVKIFNTLNPEIAQEYDDILIIKGKQIETLQHPIYSLYYYRLVLYDIVSYIYNQME